jgi:hypothetical protein
LFRIAAALVLGAKDFFSFDAREPKTTASEGLRVTAAIAGVLAQESRTKEQILQKLGDQAYPVPPHPRQAANAVLYSNKCFRREGKLFSLVQKTE